jgi:hypothetical protein
MRGRRRHPLNAKFLKLSLHKRLTRPFASRSVLWPSKCDIDVDNDAGDINK